MNLSISVSEAKNVRELNNRIDLLQRQNEVMRKLIYDFRGELRNVLSSAERGSERSYFRDKIEETLATIEAMEKNGKA